MTQLHACMAATLLFTGLTLTVACNVDVNQQRYRCDSDSDCASGYFCEAQAPSASSSIDEPMAFCVLGVPLQDAVDDAADDSAGDTIIAPDTDATDVPETCGQCDFVNGYGQCQDGLCLFAGCAEGYLDCNDDPADGCETDIWNDTSNCGVCGNDCTTSTATTACVLGYCESTCLVGLEDCNLDPSDGCETDITTDSKNCGGCGVACAAPADICVAAICVCGATTELQVVGLSPAQNASNATGATLVVDFNCPLDPASLDAAPTFIVGDQQGTISSVLSLTNSSQLVLTPDTPFKAGEAVTVTLTDGFFSLFGDAPLLPMVWSFGVRVGAITTKFILSLQDLGSVSSYRVALADMNGDGYLDMIRVESSGGIWLNDGTGAFTGAALPFADQSYPSGFVVGDANGDGHLDVLVLGGGGGTLWTNPGTGQLVDSGLFFMFGGEGFSTGGVFADFDGDGDQDLVLSEYYSGAIFWRNDGAEFVELPAVVSGLYVTALDVGDLDNDGDLDVYMVVPDGVDTILLNTGDWTWAQQPTEQALSAENVQLGDIDGDGDLDAVLGGFQLEAITWINAGDATSSTTPAVIADAPIDHVDFGDVDGDGDMDMLVVRSYSNSSACIYPACEAFEICGDAIDNNCDGQTDEAGCRACQPAGEICDGIDNDCNGIVDDGCPPCVHSELLRNDGLGQFTSLQGFAAPAASAALGDVDDDGDLDVFFGLYDVPDQLWLNQ